MRLLSFRGIPLHAHWSALFVPFVVATTNLPLLQMIALTIMVYISVILHEYGHAIAAQLRGYRCERIELWAFGGAAIGANATAIKDIFIIVGVGPLVSLAIALLSWPLIGFKLGMMVCGLNIMLFVFNLLPIYPMDGGRLFRAVLRLFGCSMTLSGKLVIFSSIIVAAIVAVFFLLRGQVLIIPMLAFIIMVGRNEIKSENNCEF